MTPNEGPHVGHGWTDGARAVSREREAHAASVMREDTREAAGEAGEEAGKRVARLPEAGAESEHVACLLLHLCVTVTDVCPKFRPPRSLRDGSGCLLPWSPGSGLDSRLGLQTPQTERDK